MKPLISPIAALAILTVPVPLAPQGRVVQLEHPETAEVEVRRGLPYADAAGPPRTADVYYPPTAGEEPLPAVVFVFAFPDSTMDLPLKDHGQYTSWARLVAAEGMVGVVYETAEPDADLERVLGWLRRESAALGIDPERIALWSCSGNVALGLLQLRRDPPVGVSAFVAYYGIMPTPDGFQAEEIDAIASRYGATIPAHGPGEAYDGGPPMLVVRAGRDDLSQVTASIDRFLGYALEQNLPVTVVNYPTGRHAFDLLDDTPETRRIVRTTLDFLEHHLHE